MDRRDRRRLDRTRFHLRERLRDPWELLRQIKVVSEVEAELVDAVICMPLPDPGYFPDNKTGVCARCGIGIYFRPHVPILPPKICVHCAVKMAEEEQDKDEQGPQSDEGNHQRRP